MREKVGKSRNTVFFQWFVAPEGRKVGWLKRPDEWWKIARRCGAIQSTPVSDHFWKLRCLKSARRCGAKQISKSTCTKHTSVGPLLEVAMSKKCTPLWREAHFEVKMHKTHQVWTPFGSCDVEKVNAVVARSTFPSQNVQSTPVSDHFWKLRCQKSARRKQISKSKCTKHTSVGPLLEVAMSKKCTPLWREAHFEVKMYKTHQVRTTFGSCDVEKVDAVVARSTFRSQNVQNTPGPDHFWKLRCRKSAHRCGAKHISKSKCTKHTSFGTLLEVEMSKKCTPLWREAHFQVKTYKTHQCRTTFGSCDVKLQNKSARRCGAKHMSKSKCTKHIRSGPLLEVAMSKKWTPLWREAHFQVKMYKAPHVRATFGGSDVEKVHAVVARSTFRSQNVQLQLQLHSTTLHYTNLHYTTLHYTALHYIPLHSTTLHYSTLHYIRLDDTAP